ncbi:hypothetical protein J7K93_04755 [bacterium]|nr:hypothetical protein [bacterium]
MTKWIFVSVVVILLLTIFNVSNVRLLNAEKNVSGTCFNHANSDCQSYQLPHGTLWVCQEGYKGHNCSDT